MSKTLVLPSDEKIEQGCRLWIDFAFTDTFQLKFEIRAIESTHTPSIPSASSFGIV